MIFKYDVEGSSKFEVKVNLKCIHKSFDFSFLNPNKKSMKV